MKIMSIDGKPVLDAKHPLSLHITRRDINNADRKRPELCAAANAMRREHKCAEVRIHLGRVYVRQNKGNWTRYITPKALRSEIIAFDRGGDFEPGEYQLQTMWPSQATKRGTRLGSKPKHTNARKNPNRKPRRSPSYVKNVRGGPA